MPLRLYSTLSKQTEPFMPIASGQVSFYTCGPTVYDFAHIGNFRSFLAADLLRRWLESPLCERVAPRDAADAGEVVGPMGTGGYRVVHVMNITDVGHMTDDEACDGGGEDKMEAARKRLLDDKKSGKLPDGADAALDPGNPYHIAEFYANAFLEDAKHLGMKVVVEAERDATLMPRPTRIVPDMLRLVLELLERGHAYIASDGVCYFNTESFPAYGLLSGNTLDAIRSGAGGRVDEATQQVKRHPADFMLWKPDPTHLMRWDPLAEMVGDGWAEDLLARFPLGEGYPGWHLECSAMARARLGDVIDLHSGGEDNIFPHHECELAQSRCATGAEALAHYWFHPRFLLVDGGKMSKSKGNFYTARDLFAKGFSPAAVRFELIKTHYRANANFTEQGLHDSAKMVDRWRRFLERADASSVEGAPNEAAARAFADAMNDDLNIAGAIGTLNTWMNETPEPTQADGELLRRIDDVLSVCGLADLAPDSGTGGGEDAHIDDLVRRRTEARAAKDWAEADRIRDELHALNVEVTDAPGGATWSRKAVL